jgi:hypothetical protein
MSNVGLAGCCKRGSESSLGKIFNSLAIVLLLKKDVAPYN